MLRSHRSPSKMVMTGLFLASLLVFTKFSLLSFIFFLWVVSRHLSALSKSKAASLIWSYLFFSAGLIALYSLAWIMGVALKPTAVLLIFSIVAWAIELGFAQKIKPVRKEQSWTSLIASLVVCGFVSLPIITHPTSIKALQYSSKTGDDINHLALIEADRSLNGFFYGNNQAAADFVNEGMNSYPQGWHINGAFLESQTVRLVGTDTINTRLLSFYLYKVLWLGLATFMVCEFMIWATEYFYGKPARRQTLLIALGALAVSGLLLVPVFGYGFQSFIAAVALLFAGLILAAKYTQKTRFRNWVIVALAALGMASSSVWIITAPMLLVPATFFVAKDLKRKKPYLETLNSGAVAVVIGLMGLALVPLYVQLKYSPATSLSAGGAAPPIWWVGVVGVWLSWAWLSYKHSAYKLGVAMQLVVVVFLEFLFLAVYQQLKIGQQQYYSIKVTFAVASVGLALFLASLIHYIFSTKFRTRFLVKPAIYALVLLAIPFCLGLDLRKSAFPLKGTAPIGRSAAKIVLTNSAAWKDLIVLSNDPSESYLATKLAVDIWVHGDVQERQVVDQLAKAVQSEDVWQTLNQQLSSNSKLYVVGR